MGVPVDGLEELWRLTRGDPRVSVAVLDGPVDRSHPAFGGADLSELAVAGGGVDGAAGRHGTFVASLIFGIAPRCRGLILPVFREGPGGEVRPCSQSELASAIARAAAAGADVINVSAGEPEDSGAGSTILAETIASCRRRGILVVAAEGNDGDARHVPATLPGVLAVGGLDASGRPLSPDRPGPVGRGLGLLAPAEGLVGAVPGGGYATSGGTSFATALVSGAAALLLSLARQRGRPLGVEDLVDLLLRTADGCPPDAGPSSPARPSACRLNLSRIVRTFEETSTPMSHVDGLQAAGDAPAASAPTPRTPPAPASSCGCGGAKGGCGCRSCGGGRALVFAQGQIGYDLVSEGRRDSILQHMDGDHAQPADRGQMLAYLDAHPWEAASITWTLNFDQTPIYAIRPGGPFAAEAYARLRQFLAEDHAGEIERISVAGEISGEATLLSGATVPVIVPEIRGLASWTTRALAEAVAGAAPPAGASADEVERHRRKLEGVRNLLDRVYHELRNFGLASPDRALNYAATNALLVGEVFEAAARDEVELDTVGVERSATCRDGADCWDVTMTFFNPRQPWQSPRKSFRLTVDVSDVVPVMVGRVRSWSLR